MFYILTEQISPIFKIACMTSHRYCHFALHVNLKNTCILLMHCSLCLCNEKKELDKCFTTFKLFCNIRFLEKIQWDRDCCILWPAYDHCALQMLVKICFLNHWQAYGCNLQKHISSLNFVSIFLLLVPFFSFFIPKLWKKHILTSAWSAQKPNASQNIQQERITKS